ncbi:ImmA/IrrE family metallo-endopeptidase [Dactylosporangium sp. CA-139066]|uniref:ImmA/IrrE family metallo-endopeptidase n=1 Tax=Dactylosporangium sp. CA-139066 TaxID=3239930 RepID=UPI003D92F41F
MKDQLRFGGPHRRVRRIIRELDLPRSFDLRTLTETIAARRGRPIVLTAMPLSAAGPCGLWLATASTDYVCFEQHTSPLHQHHIVLHELGHVVCGHGGSQSIKNLLGELAPQLSATTLDIMLARHHGTYQDVQETEAELFAHMVLSSTSAANLDPVAVEGLSDEHRRLIDVLERG